MEFLQTLIQHQFLQNALIAGVISSVICGIIGSFVVIKRIAFISGGIAHAVLGGVGIAYFLSINTLVGALIFAILSAIILGVTSLYGQRYEDTAISAIWSVGMAVGLLFIYLTPGYNVDLLTYLFGNILLISSMDLILLSGLSAFILLIIFIFFRQFVAISFDEQFAKLRGINTDLIYIILLCLIALTVVILMRVVGLIMVIALLSLPAAISESWTKKLFAMMVTASILSMIFIFLGLLTSFSLNIPPGAVIVLLAGIGYLSSFSLKKILN